VAKQKPIILSDESINSYGFRVLTNGIALGDFLKNPIMFYNHDRDALPIGKWEDVKVEDGKLIASPNFDDNDPFAVQIQSKYVQGILNAASMGIDILDVSEEPGLILAGQRRGTIVKSSLFEASIADIPSNKSCIKLHFKKENITLSGQFPEAFLTDNLPLINQPKNMKQIALKLGLPETATEAEIVSAIERNNLKLQGATDAGVKALVAMAERKGFAKETVEKLAKVDFENTLSLVSGTPDKTGEPEKQTADQVRLSDVLNELKNQNAGNSQPRNLTLSEYEKQAPEDLKKIILTDKAKYAALHLAEYNSPLSDDDYNQIVKAVK
jgi:hypothetical protein